MSSSDFSHLRALAAVAECRGFRAAARLLMVSPSALSQTIRALEEDLGLPLLLRTTRSVTLTEAGVQLLADTKPLLEGLKGALNRVKTLGVQAGAEVCGTLRLNIPRSAVTLWASQWIAPFLAAHPGIQLEITSSDWMIDIVRKGFDAGVRFPESLPQDMVAIAAGPMQRFVVAASPGLIEKTGYPLSPQDLAEFPCIALRFTDGRLYRWQFQRGDISCAIDVKGALTVDDQQLALRAAVDGVGWAYLYESLAAPYLADSRLIEALAEWRPAEAGFQLYYPSRRQVSPALRALIDWLKADRSPPRKRNTLSA